MSAVTEILAVGDAARLLGCTPQNVRKLEERGVLACSRTVGGMRLFAVAEVRRVKALRDARPTKWHPIVGTEP